MNDAVNLHATCIAIKHNGILLLGKSGAGKSDLALRLIENKNAILVADDRVDIKKIDDKIFASSPHTIKGLLEVRGIGIIKVPCLEQCDIKLAVNLVDDTKQIERMPENKFYEIQQIKIPMIDIYPFEVSATDKIVIKLKAILE